MPSLKQFQALDDDLRKDIIKRMIFRKKRYLALMREKKFVEQTILLVGDRPAPSAPDDPEFHYTPFAALWNSSLYINLALARAGIDEAKLTWINAYDFHDQPTDASVLRPTGEYPWRNPIALGGQASKYLTKNGIGHQIVQHPAAWKRFHSKEAYPLIATLEGLGCRTSTTSA